MSQIEDEYKKRFNDRELPNDGFDSEGLWDAITEELDEVPPKNNMKKGLFLVVLLFLMGSLIGTYLWNQNVSVNVNQNLGQHENGDQKVNQEEGQNLNRNKNLEQNIVIDNKTNSSAIPSEDNKEPKVQSISLNRIVSTNKKYSTIKEAKYSSVKNARLTVTVPTDYRSKEITKLEKYILSDHTILSDHPNDQSTISLKDSPTKDINFTALPTADQISTRVLSLLPTEWSFLDANRTLVFDLPTPKVTTRKSVTYQLGLWGGINQFNLKYKPGNTPEFSDLKETIEAGNLGFSFGVSATIVRNNRWLLNTGIEFHQLWSKFEFDQQQFIQVEKEDQLLQLWVDAVTGDTLNTHFGDAMVDATETRKVKHYNKYQRFSIPIEIGIQKTNGNNWTYGFTAGGMLNLNILQSGKTLKEDQRIDDFDKNSSDAPFKTFNIGIRVNPFIGYRFPNHWMIKIHPQWTWQPGADVNGTGLKLSASQFNLNLGVAYSFH